VAPEKGAGSPGFPSARNPTSRPYAPYCRAGSIPSQRASSCRPKRPGCVASEYAQSSSVLFGCHHNQGLALGLPTPKPRFGSTPELRSSVCNALIHDDQAELYRLAVQLANARVVPKRSSTQHLDLSWSDRDSDVAALSPRLGGSGWVVPLKELMGPSKHWKAPILFDLPRALAAAIVSFTR
jgi:hypothetical protein